MRGSQLGQFAKHRMLRCGAPGGSQENVARRARLAWSISLTHFRTSIYDSSTEASRRCAYCADRDRRVEKTLRRIEFRTGARHRKRRLSGLREGDEVFLVCNAMDRGGGKFPAIRNLKATAGLGWSRRVGQTSWRIAKHCKNCNGLQWICNSLKWICNRGGLQIGGVFLGIVLRRPETNEPGPEPPGFAQRLRPRL